MQNVNINYSKSALPKNAYSKIVQGTPKKVTVFEKFSEVKQCENKHKCVDFPAGNKNIGQQNKGSQNLL